MSSTTENILLIITATILSGFSVLGVSQSWLAAIFAAIAAVAGAAFFLSIR